MKKLLILLLTLCTPVLAAPLILTDKAALEQVKKNHTH